MIKVDFNKKVPCPLTEKEAELVAKTASKFEKKIKGMVEITLIGDDEIKKLNKLYRGISKVTDVLSFAWEEDQVVPSSLLGQIYISYPQIKRQSKIFKCSPQEEGIRMLVHGLLHIVGYDHADKNGADKMFGLQEKIVTSVKRKLGL